ncbi:MAG: ATP-binding protein [bacterium]|nr:ATP-binding protein [bacterium]MCY4257968.1 ATP-binding protein [bacterium]
MPTPTQAPQETPQAEQNAALELSLVNDLRELTRVAAAIEEFCTRQGLGSQLAYTLNLSVEEILSFSIENSFEGDKTQRIELALHRDPSELLILIAHDGQPLSTTQIPSSAGELILNDSNLDALGLALVHRVMDTVSVQRQQGCNIVVMTKQIPQQQDQEDAETDTQDQEQ